MARLRWALAGWQAALDELDADQALSFNGFTLARGQTVFIHNALYYDEARRLLDWPLRVRLGALRQLTDLAIEEAASVVVQTDWMAGLVAGAHGIARESITVASPIPEPATPIERRVLLEGPSPHLLFVGSELAYKDPGRFGELVASSGGTGHMVGNFEPREAAPGCHWYGSLTRPEVFACYRDADVLVMTSHAESFGLPIVEAWMSGLPVLAVDQPYARELCGDAACYYLSELDDIVAELDRLNHGRQRDRLEELKSRDGYQKMLDVLSSCEGLRS